MAQTPVVIVGAGPSGLVLALSLARYGVSSTILEKECGITEDPRGVYLAGDANRIMENLGVGSDKMDIIGHQVEKVLFHKSSFQNSPFYSLDTSRDTLHQVVPEGVLQIQPKLGKVSEDALRSLIAKSSYCDLREGCEVTGREELDQGIRVSYTGPDGTKSAIECEWLIGADGKKGIVRKHFLEPTSNIKQETGLFSYEGTWVAANLKLHPPTPETHPDFPLWKLGFTSDRVYDLFWPIHWHFCSPPGEPTACGRFGPHKDRIWRHEIAVPDWNDAMDAEKALLNHLLPMVTRSTDESGNPFPCGSVPFPRECIEILRCRPFTFAQKVVNKWFHGRTILIGDAAHVFPPFGGQGIACGIRDAYGLAWRLAILLSLPRATQKQLTDNMLTAWACERRQGVDDSTRLTMMNGMMCNEEETLGLMLLRNLMELFKRLPVVGSLFELKLHIDEHGYKPTKNGFFLPSSGGGAKLAQVYMRSPGKKPVLSDQLLRRSTVMTILIIGKYDTNLQSAVADILRKLNIPSHVISEDSIVFINPDSFSSEKTADKAANSHHAYDILRKESLGGIKLRGGYDHATYLERLGRSTKFAIIRPDGIIYAAVKSLPQIEQGLLALRNSIAL